MATWYWKQYSIFKQYKKPNQFWEKNPISSRYHFKIWSPYHIISYHIISYHIISYHIISYHIISYHIISYHIISNHIISYHIISYHIISYHIISYHIISYHVISYYVLNINVLWDWNKIDHIWRYVWIRKVKILLSSVFKHQYECAEMEKFDQKHTSGKSCRQILSLLCN